MPDFRPCYLDLAESGELAERARRARAMLGECCLCPHRCAVDRLRGERGRCRTGDRAIVSSHGPHFGEESPLVGHAGSGTIFLTNCNLGCVFCQNAEISAYGNGEVVSTEALAGTMLELQDRGCHNINFVTPTHQVPMILEALAVAAEGGLRLPLVYNCGGYEALPTLRLLDGVFDIYMPDCKYADDEVAARLSGAPDYWERNQEAVREMQRQVGDLVVDGRGIARRGLLVRHLVLPNGLAGTERVVAFLASLSTDTYLNVMAQYRPCHQASNYPEIARSPTAKEYQQAVQLALDAGLTRLDQGPGRLR
jgi:putative pyruvate formate lyase activating enzyme